MKKILLIGILFITLSACSFSHCDRQTNTCGQKVKIGKWLTQ